MRVKMGESSKPIQIILNDRWFNPTDSVSAAEGLYVISISRKNLGINDNRWHDIVVKCKENKNASVWIDNKKRHSIKCRNRTEHGVSYLHLLGGCIPDNTGVLIEKVYGKAHTL